MQRNPSFSDGLNGLNGLNRLREAIYAFFAVKSSEEIGTSYA